MSPFAYNESTSQEHDSLTKSEALALGYRWKDSEEKAARIDIRADNLPDHIKDTNEDILSKTIGCMHNGECPHLCTEGFRVIKQELDLYRRINVPLPRLCPNCRHYERLKLKNPWKLWSRACQCAGNTSKNKVYNNSTSHPHGSDPCPNTFETSYAPERPEIVYCEGCYQQEIA